MKMGNIVPRAGIEPTSLALRASVLSLHDVGSLMSPLYSHLPVYAVPCLRGQCRLYTIMCWNLECGGHIGEGVVCVYFCWPKPTFDVHYQNGNGIKWAENSWVFCFVFNPISLNYLKLSYYRWRNLKGVIIYQNQDLKKRRDSKKNWWLIIAPYREPIALLKINIVSPPR